MDYAEIDVRALKAAINAVLDHLIEDLGHEKIELRKVATITALS
jgi:hypothetical protein